MADGKAQAFGPKDEVLAKVLRRPGQPGQTQAAAPLKVVPEPAGAAS
jgi:ABC-type protease/lipase transport system fused ATPase/permease subunit